MNLQNPTQVSIVIAGSIAVLGVLLLVSIAIFSPFPLPVWTWALGIPVLFSLTYGLTWWSVEKLIYGRIQMLFRTIHSPEVAEKKVSNVVQGSDPLTAVQRDVQEWAAGKQDEIKNLKEQARFRRDFIGNLAHELRTPIFSIQGYLATLAEGGLEDPKINYDYLARADKNLERLITLVEDLSNISDLESGREALNIDKFNLVDLVQEVFQLLELRAAEKNISFRFNKKYDKPLLVKADRARLAQVFSNLLLNTIIYGKFDGFSEVRFLDMQETVLVEVADDGMGVSPEDLPRLFERFFRADKSRSRNVGGSGLGLAIVKHIIESHGQSINVRSVVDKGTTFSFTLEKAR